MKNQSLEQKIADLTAKHEFETAAAVVAGDTKHNAVYSPGKSGSFLVLNPGTLDEARALLERLQPVQDWHEVGERADRYYKLVDSPYKMTIINPAMCSQWTTYELRIEFKIDLCSIWLETPLSLIPYEFERASRKISDSEHHYFTGLSSRELREKTVPCYAFKKRGGDNVVNYYGGDTRTKNAEEIRAIIEAIKN